MYIQVDTPSSSLTYIDKTHVNELINADTKIFYYFISQKYIVLLKCCTKNIKYN